MLSASVLWRAPSRLAAVLLALAAACSDSPTAPAGRARLTILATPRWHTRARALVAAANTDPPMASRVYALLGVAQDSAARAAAAARVSVPAAVTAASAAVLGAAFPASAAALTAEAKGVLATPAWSADAAASVPAGDTLGRRVADAVLARAATDGSALAWTGTIPTGPGIWFSSVTPAAAAPLRPGWGTVRPWFLSAGNEFRPAAPPAWGSPAFQQAVTEVRTLSDTRTPRQLEIAQYWADGAGTPTPPGHWDDITGELVLRYNLSETDAARVFSLVGRAVMDAGVAVWDTKFAYWCLRPSQVDPAITLPIGLPNFPSYPSGHAGFSGAASAVLGALFPAERAGLAALADEAALSRVYGGIHFRFDGDAGLALGRAVAAKALAAERARGVPTFARAAAVR